MDRRTADLLDRLNRRFYRRRAEEFSETRARPWRGWEPVRDELARRAGPEPPRILDAGCGNGRFGRFLAEGGSGPFDYTGVDASPELVAAARRALPPGDGGRRRFVVADLLAPGLWEAGPAPPSPAAPKPAAGAAALAGERFDLIALFGVLHHVPGLAARRRLIAALARRLAPGGLLALSFWQFLNEERYRRRVVPWTELADELGGRPAAGELEEGDVVLAWGAVPGAPDARRYCHHTGDREAERLAAGSGLTTVARYHADGRSGEANYYFLLEADGDG